MDTLLTLTALYAKFRLVERTMLAKGSDRRENDAEHSFHMAFLAWAIIDDLKLQLDKAKVFELCLAHDLVEIYAGDTFAMASEEYVASKVERERLALQQLQAELPGFPTLIKVIEEYEALSSEEACFAYALDKLAPFFVSYLDGGRICHEVSYTQELMRADKGGKVDRHPLIKAYYQQMLDLVAANPGMFPATAQESGTKSR